MHPSSSTYSFSMVFMDGPTIRKTIKRSAQIVGFGFILLLALLVTINSSSRNSVLDANTTSSRTDSYFAGVSDSSTDSSRLHLQDFKRVAIKDGKTIWEVSASDAQYYSADGVSYLNDASLTMFQDDGGKISLRADAAKLHMGVSGLSRAELMGSVVVVWDNGMTIETESALYKLKDSEISAPAWVRIEGDGYKIEGSGLYAQIDRQRLTLARNVRSVFTGVSGDKARRSGGAKKLLEQMKSENKPTKR